MRENKGIATNFRSVYKRCTSNTANSNSSFASVPKFSMLTSLASFGKAFVQLIRPLYTLFYHLPEFGHIKTSGYHHTALSNGYLLCNRSSGLVLAVLRSLECPLCNNGHVEPLIMLWLLALRLMPVVEGDFIRSSNKDSSDSNGIMQWRPVHDTKDVAKGKC